jgi:hypothetical protein
MTPIYCDRYGKPLNGLLVCADGRKVYYKAGLRHRLTGPAYFGQYNYLTWWYKGVRHNSKDVAVVSGSNAHFVPLYHLYGQAAETKELFLDKAWRRKAILEYAQVKNE